MDQGKFSILALFGAGLLVGAALAVILPEGVETLSKSMLAKKAGSSDDLIESINSTIGWSLVAGFCTMFLIDNLFPSHHTHDEVRQGTQPDNDSAACLEEIPMTQRGSGTHDASEFTLHNLPDGYGQRAHALGDESSLSVISPTATLQQQPRDIESGNDSAWQSSAASKPQWQRILGQLLRALSPRYLPSTLIGILVHSCADGLALGAAVAASAAQSSSSPSSQDHTSSLEIIVFLALLLHKAPAAFGLITTLKQQGYASYKLSIWLSVFAISAPLAALLTFAVFSMVGSKPNAHSEDEPAVQPWAGVIMLYSAGTFLYVAMAHTLVEAIHQAKLLRAKAKAGLQSETGIAGLSFIDIGVLLFGVILPPLVSKDHDD
ncbi:hypothetical protein IWW36_005315 [Coemansia brasiliensis]|uniref:Zinc/iron permease n=1 Tax=Coemansia brasiliensis TaxID=2650707 RepID=A0A9W8LWR9_9FUNG|nr:hypothetical protein IWW36_005315 [Coemansia brasiliensis]